MNYEKLTEKFLDTLVEMSVIDSISDIYQIAKEVLSNEVTVLFLDQYPDSLDETIVLLDKTIEGQVGMEWEILTLSPSQLDVIQRYWLAVRETIVIHRDSARLGYCFACERRFMMLPDVPDRKSQQAAKQLMKQHKLIAVKCLCPNCCGNLKTDSDYKGLVYI